MTYEEYYKAKVALEYLLPEKRDIENDEIPEVIALKAAEFRLVVLGALAELNGEGWEDDE